MAAAYAHTRAGVVQLDPAHAGQRREEKEINRLAEEKLAFFGQRLMGYRWNQPAYSLSYANRRRLEIARAIALTPRILLLDEPAAGMNPAETHEITELIAKLRKRARLHDPRHRARHARRRGNLGPRRRARPRHQDRRGHVRRGRDRRARRRGVPRPAHRGDEVVALLELDAVDTYYGQIHILQNLNLQVAEGELVCLLGGNASGKSTTLKTILGIVAPQERRRPLRRRGRHARDDEPPHRARDGDRPREPAPVRADDRAREPRDGRVPPRRRHEGGLRARLLALPAALRAAVAARRARSPAASSRWSRWGAR